MRFETKESENYYNAHCYENSFLNKQIERFKSSYTMHAKVCKIGCWVL